MPDTKITALTAIGANPIIPSTFPIPMVDLTDTSMAASGTTKKVTVNQILGAGGTATLASATISGDLTVDTNTLKVDSANNRVGVGTASPGALIEAYTNTNGQNRVFINNPSTGSSAYNSIDFTGGTAGNQILSMGSGYSGSFPYTTGALVLRSGQVNGMVLSTGGSAAPIVFGINDSEAMRLNSTGLGVGRSPSYRLQASSGTKATTASLATVAGITTTDADDFGIYFRLKTDATGANRYAAITAFDNGAGNGARDLVLQDLGGNVGIGVVPSAWNSAVPALQVKGVSGVYGAGSSEFGSVQNCFYNASAAWIYGTTAAAGRYAISSGSHQWFTAASGTAGTTITDFATAKMTLDASGNLLVGTTVSPSGTKIGSIAKLGKVNVEGTNTVTVSTSVVALARAYDTGGLFFISGYNSVGGNQGWWLVASRGGTVTTIASDNGTGLTVAFTAPGSVLSMNTTSGTLSVSCISMTNQSV